MSHLCWGLQHSGDEQQSPFQHSEPVQRRQLADEAHFEDAHLAGRTEEVHCGALGELIASEVFESQILLQAKEAARLEEKERLLQEELAKLDQQLEQKRRRLRRMEEMEAQLKAELKSLTRRQSGSGCC